MHPPFVECHAVQAFSVASNFDPKLMPREQNQIMLRKVCTVIKSRLSRLLNHHSSHSYDRKKHHTLLISIRRINIVHNVTNVEQHELFEINAGRPLPNVTPKRANMLAVVVEDVQSHFFQTTAATEATRHACQARFESPVGKRQHIPGKPPGERPLSFQEARTWRPIPLRANLLHQPVESLHERIRSGTHH